MKSSALKMFGSNAVTPKSTVIAILVEWTVEKLSPLTSAHLIADQQI